MTSIRLLPYNEAWGPSHIGWLPVRLHWHKAMRFSSDGYVKTVSLYPATRALTEFVPAD